MWRCEHVHFCLVLCYCARYVQEPNHFTKISGSYSFKRLVYASQQQHLKETNHTSKTKTKTKNATHSFTGKQVTAHLFQNRIRKQKKRIRPTDTRNPNVEVILIVGVFWHFIPNSKVHLVVWHFICFCFDSAFTSNFNINSLHFSFGWFSPFA